MADDARSGDAPRDESDVVMIAIPARDNCHDDKPVNRDAGMEIAQNAIPTPAWTAPKTRRPQRPTGHFK